MGRRGPFFWCLLLGTLAWGAPPLPAQELLLKRDYPGSRPFECPSSEAPAPPSLEERLQATQLASSADQALVLGDLTRAAALLARAIELDPSSPELAYRQGRLFEDLGDRPAAIGSYCRVLATETPESAATDADTRLQSLVAADLVMIPAAAVDAFRTGLALADAGRDADAADSFGAALANAPGWADAVYNRAVMLERMGQEPEAIADLRRYLQFRPGAEDAVAVSQRIGRIEGVSAAAPSAGTALTLGLVLPGMGQFYSGRARGGFTVLSLAGGAAAAGVFIREIEVQCLAAVEPGGDCPSGQDFRQTITRPYLAPALGVAATVVLIGAIEAFVHARRRGAAASALPPPAAPGEARFTPPSLSIRRGRVDVNVVRLTF